jgi:hypothetical protein
MPCAAFVAALSLPLLQSSLSLVPENSLGGVSTPLSPCEPGIESWNDGSVQLWIEARIRREIGLRGWMARADNELRLRAFGSAKRPVVAGADGWLLEDGYLPTNMIARSEELALQIITRAHNFHRLQVGLEERGVQLAALISPSKAWTYPERMPWPHDAAMRAMAERITYPEALRASLEIAGARTFDLGKLFREWKRTDPAGSPPLFPHGGIHWSNHASARAAIHVLQGMESSAGVNFPALELKTIENGKDVGGSEDDLVRLANLLDTSRWNGAIAQPSLKTTEGGRVPSVPILIVGSSFSWELARHCATDGCAQPVTIWYYFLTERRVEGETWTEGRPVDKSPDRLREVMLAQKVILVECNESAAESFGMGFLEAALEAIGIEPVSAPPPDFLARVQDRILESRR